MFFGKNPQTNKSFKVRGRVISKTQFLNALENILFGLQKETFKTNKKKL